MRRFALLLAVVVLVSCGGSGDDDASDEVTSTTDQTTTTVSTPATTSPTSSTTSTTAATTAPPTTAATSEAADPGTTSEQGALRALYEALDLGIDGESDVDLGNIDSEQEACVAGGLEADTLDAALADEPITPAALRDLVAVSQGCGVDLATVLGLGNPDGADIGCFLDTIDESTLDTFLSEQDPDGPQLREFATASIACGIPLSDDVGIDDLDEDDVQCFLNEIDDGGLAAFVDDAEPTAQLTRDVFTALASCDIDDGSPISEFGGTSVDDLVCLFNRLEDSTLEALINGDEPDNSNVLELLEAFSACGLDFTEVG